MPDFLKYIDPALLALVPVLYFVAEIYKKSFRMDTTKIPLALGITGIVLATAWVLATNELDSWRHVVVAIFTAIVQGLLCAGAAVYANQIYKQQVKARLQKKK